MTVILAMALPTFNTTLKNMHLGSAASSLSGGIQAARYMAISKGCPYQITVAAGGTTYQLATQVLSGTPPACANAYTNVGAEVPFSTSDVTVVSGQTFLLNPSGTVTSTTALNSPGTFSIQLTNGYATKTVTVTGVGNVKVTVP